MSIDSVYAQEKEQLWALLGDYPNEIDGLRNALIEGRMDHQWYWNRVEDCGCIVGHLLRLHYPKESNEEIEARGIRYFEANDERCSDLEDLLYYHVSIGDKPRDNAYVGMLVHWIDEYKLSHQTNE